MQRDDPENLRNRRSPLDMSAAEFRQAGHQLVESLAEFLDSMPAGKVTAAPTVSEIQSVLGNAPLPREGTDTSLLLREVVDLLKRHSLFNGHPRFWGYITSSPTPIGALADFMASTFNPNLGAWQLSPLASEIEAQTIRWIAEFVGYPTDCGGLMVSGGNMANFVGFLAGRRAQIPWDIRKKGLQGGGKPPCVYCSEAAHTWVEKAADLFGLGTDAIRWIPCDKHQRMDVEALMKQVESDRARGDLPLMAIAAAGSVGTGAVDPINTLAELCESEKLWLHVDGAYGAMAAALPEAAPELKALRRADSLALDPHKWLYAPLEAGCVLVRNAKALQDTFSFHPNYYTFDLEGEQPPTNYYELGMQNSRGFRALKVWLAFRQAGGETFVRTIRQDIGLAQALLQAVSSHPELEPFTCQLSIVTFRFVPKDLALTGSKRRDYLNELNEALLEELQKEGDNFVSNAVIGETFLLRACIVNFRTTLPDVQRLPGNVARIGRQVASRLSP